MKFKLLILLLFISQLISAADLRINSSFVPSSIIKGQSVTYTITIENFDGDDIAVEIPKIDGLNISGSHSDSFSSSSFISFSFNGRSMQSGTKTLTRSWQVKPTREGQFKMPSLTVKIDGSNYRVPPASLAVNKMSEQFKQIIFMELDLPKQNIYAGESMKAVLRLYIAKNRINIQKIHKPAKRGDAFAVSELPDRPNQGQINKNGIRYQTLSWPFKLTALKAGKAELGFDLDTLIGRFMNASWLTFSTDEFSRNVLELPADSPDSFNGAIGEFQTKVFTSSNQTEVGEPITLNLELTGEGNFDRIAPPEILETDDWKIYPPKSEFVSSDDLGLIGTKSVEYIIIPQNDSITQLPVIPFSFFNSKNNQYEELTMPPLPIKVKPASNGTTQIQPQTYTQNNDVEKTKIKPFRTHLLPIKQFSRHWISDPVWIFQRPLFMYFQGVPLFLIAGLYFVRKRQLRLQNDSAFARRIEANKSVRKWLAIAHEAIGRNQHDKFFDAAFRVIQQSIGQYFNCSADTLTESEMIDCLKQGKVSEQQVEFIKNICQLNDSAKFSGGSLSLENLKEWEDNLNKFVGELGKFKRV